MFILLKKNVPRTFLAAFENPVYPHGIVYIYTYILIVRSQKAEDKLESLTTTDAPRGGGRLGKLHASGKRTRACARFMVVLGAFLEARGSSS